jgi:hypothetical protein
MLLVYFMFVVEWLLLVLFWLLLLQFWVFYFVLPLIYLSFYQIGVTSSPFWRIGLRYVQFVLLSTSIVQPHLLPANLFSIEEHFSTFPPCYCVQSSSICCPVSPTDTECCCIGLYFYCSVVGRNSQIITVRKLVAVMFCKL